MPGVPDVVASSFVNMAALLGPKDARKIREFHNPSSNPMANSVDWAHHLDVVAQGRKTCEALYPSLRLPTVASLDSLVQSIDRAAARTTRDVYNKNSVRHATEVASLTEALGKLALIEEKVEVLAKKSSRST